MSFTVHSNVLLHQSSKFISAAGAILIQFLLFSVWLSCSHTSVCSV